MSGTRRVRPLLGTFVEVGTRDSVAAGVIDVAFARIEHAQSMWSFHDACSELSRLNSASGVGISLHRQTLRLLRIAKTLMQRSSGAFNCTVGGMLVINGILPDHGGPAPLPYGEANDIEIGQHWARLRRPVRLTLDGIAKGYAIDLAIYALKQQGLTNGWVNAGGDLRVFGDVELPVQRRELNGCFTSLGLLREAALASSRVLAASAFSDESSTFPACIVAPVGQQPEPGVWTVLARSAWRADALTKVAATVSTTQRKALIQQLGGCLVEPSKEMGA